jgi:hypothetical protein
VAARVRVRVCVRPSRAGFFVWPGIGGKGQRVWQCWAVTRTRDVAGQGGEEEEVHGCHQSSLVT